MDKFDNNTELEILQNYKYYSPRNIFFPVFYEWEFAIPSILEKKKYDLILFLLDKLKYPFFQEEILFHLTKNDCIALCSKIIRQDIPRGKFLAALLLEQWLDSIIKFGELLDDYANQHHDSIFQKEIDAAKIKRDGYLQNIGTDLSLFASVLGLPFVVKFAFSQKMDETVRETSHKKNNNEVLSLLQKKLLEHEDFEKIPFTELDVLCLLSLIQKKHKDNDVSIIPKIMDVLNEKILSATNFISIDLSEKNIDLMRKYCFGLLNLSSKDIFLHLEKYRTCFEGYNALLGNKYENISREVFVLCSTVFLFEHNDFFSTGSDEKQTLFRKLSNYVLCQINRCPDGYFVEHYYLIPLQLLKIIVEQIYSDEKNWFDEQILNLDNIKMILLVLQYSQTELDEAVRKKLTERLANEWQDEKKMLLRSQEKLIEKLDSLAKKLTMTGGLKN